MEVSVLFGIGNHKIAGSGAEYHWVVDSLYDIELLGYMKKHFGIMVNHLLDASMAFESPTRIEFLLTA